MKATLLNADGSSFQSVIFRVVNGFRNTVNPSMPRAPEVSNVTSSLADGQYGPGQEVEILVKYNFPVTVLGTPRLWLDLGDADRYANFTGMNNGTNDMLVFAYIVREGLWQLGCNVFVTVSSAV